MRTPPSLTVQQGVVLTAHGATNDDNTGSIGTPGFEWGKRSDKILHKLSHACNTVNNFASMILQDMISNKTQILTRYREHTVQRYRAKYSV